MLYSSAWRNKEGNILLTFVNISEEEKDLEFSLDTAEYGINEGATMVVNGEVRPMPTLANGEVREATTIGGCSTLIYEFKLN